MSSSSAASLIPRSEDRGSRSRPAAKALKRLGRLCSSEAWSKRPLGEDDVVRLILDAALIPMCGFLMMATLSPAESAVPGEPANKAACVSITQYGAQSNGGDATGAINNAVDAARGSPAKCVYVPSGTFEITRIIIDDGVKMIGNQTPRCCSRPIRTTAKSSWRVLVPASTA